MGRAQYARRVVFTFAIAFLLNCVKTRKDNSNVLGQQMSPESQSVLCKVPLRRVEPSVPFGDFPSGHTTFNLTSSDTYPKPTTQTNLRFAYLIDESVSENAASDQTLRLT